MLLALRQNLAGMLLAVALSSLLWTVAVSQQNPDRTDFFPQTLILRPDNLADGLMLVNERNLPDVRARVTAPSDYFRRAWPGTIQARVDLRGAVVGSRQYPVVVETTDRRVHVVSWDPDQIRLTIERVARKEVPVKINVDSEVPFGFVFREPRAVPDVVTVIGPASLVESVGVATVNVGLSNERTTYSRDLQPVPRSADGAEVRGATLSPSRVRVEVPIEQQAAYKVVPVVPAAGGTPRSGYQVAGIAVDPASATIVGEPRVVESLQFVQTEPIDLNGATGDIIQGARVRLPAGVALVRDQIFTLRIQVAPLVGSQIMRVAPTTTNVSERLQSTVLPGAVDVLISGPVPALVTLQPRDVRLIADVKGLGAGPHGVPLKAEVPSALRVERLEPDRVLVTLTARE